MINDEYYTVEDNKLVQVKTITLCPKCYKVGVTEPLIFYRDKNSANYGLICTRCEADYKKIEDLLKANED